MFVAMSTRTSKLHRAVMLAKLGTIATTYLYADSAQARANRSVLICTL
jgi:hypothetical protein